MGRRARRRETTHQACTHGPRALCPPYHYPPIAYDHASRSLPLPSNRIRSCVALMIACAHPTKEDVARASVQPDAMLPR
ncbi:hypothetical protein B0H10DRAFT_2131563 [Mycena sp. CBHHK59/15]|nr:hypothetical protein B0H10DRAFT_2131563 [Mycena sp. CBHHK59/15]